jgi:hypothetical protein
VRLPNFRSKSDIWGSSALPPSTIGVIQRYMRPLTTRPQTQLFEARCNRAGIVDSYDLQTPDLRFRKPFQLLGSRAICIALELDMEASA